MPESRGTLELAVDELGTVLAPLATGLTPDRAPAFFASLGIVMTPAQAASLGAAFGTFTSGLTQLVGLLNELVAAIRADDTGKIVQKGVAAAAELARVIQGLTTLSTALGALPQVTPQLQAQLPGRIFNHLLAGYLGRNVGVNEVLEFTGILEREDFNVESADPAKPFHTVDTFHFDRLGGWLSEPGKQLSDLYDWGKPGAGFDGRKLLRALEKLLAMLGLPVLYDDAGPRLDLVAVEIVPRTDLSPRGIALRLTQGGAPVALEFTGPGWKVTVAMELALLPGAQLVLQPDGAVTFVPPDKATAEGKVRVGYSVGRGAADPLVLLGFPGGSRVVAGELGAWIEAGLRWTGAGATGELGIGGELKQGKAVLSMSEGDGFLARILSGLRVENDFALGFGYSTAEGLHFHGSSTLEIKLASHIQLGPVELQALTLTVGISGSRFPIGVSTDIKAALGPLTAVVEGVGVEVALELKGDRSGNLGPVDLKPGFKPPRGVGLSVDAGVVKGGGYLFFDFDRGEYAGALELTFAGWLSLKAIGLVTTRMPDGSKGFSLLIIITAEFGSGIQLGFGFTLIGVGGLLGLNRTMRMEALAEGVRTGGVNGIMFPQDVVANAPRIISDLRAFFPPQEGRFLVGPMAKLGWGTPTLVSLSLGIIIEIPPGNIAILGVLRLALPDAKAALLVLQVSFIGALEFDKKRAWFFASLFESRVLFITIEGEMGVLAAFGDDANFVVSVGGFHPSFSPPPLPFPVPRRVAVNILNTDWARIRVEGYFAVTSNTAQFGARVELYFGFSALNVSGHIGFDALFQFSPFYFIIEVSASFGVKVFGIGLFSISVRMSLEGPAKWRARGTGTITLLFWDIDVDFDVTWGEERDTTLPPVEVLPILKAELEKAQNWRAELPAGGGLRVTLRKLPEEEAALVLHPVGMLRVTQRALPLGLTLDKVGSQKPSDVNRLSVTVAPGGLARRDDVWEQFAPAQFQTLGDGDKLSRPAYGPERGGLDLAPTGEGMASSRVVRRTVRYEEVVVDTGWRRRVRFLRLLAGGLFRFLLKGGSVGKNALSLHQKTLLQPFADRVTVRPEGYAVVFQADNRAFTPQSAAFASEAGAREFLRAQTALDPNLSETLHVIPEFERAA